MAAEVYIHSIATALPDNVYPQTVAMDRMLEWTPGEKEKRVIRRIYSNSGIETRYSVLPDFTEGKSPLLFKFGKDGHPVAPGTGERNDVFAREGTRLAVSAARKALEKAGSITPGQITHVITTTCTGFSNPGPDYHIVRDLGLKYSTRRFALGFMGCYAAIPAMQMAAEFCRADPGSVVLVVSLELCSLHLNFASDVDSLLANSLFSDGAAAVVISAIQPGGGGGAFSIGRFASNIVASGENDMAWKIGNKGFAISLSSYVPKIICSNLDKLLEPLSGLPPRAIDVWAVHPGGKAIVDGIARGLDLSEEQVEASRATLRQYGNMSSATILFVLQRVLETCGGKGRKSVYAIAFGPGLSVETASLTLEAG